MYFKRVLHNILVYKKELILNIIFSTLYAFFSALAFLSLMPMLEVLFNGSPKINIKPSYENYDSTMAPFFRPAPNNDLSINNTLSIIENNNISIINEFKIENQNRPKKEIIYPIALILLSIFGYLNIRRRI